MEIKFTPIKKLLKNELQPAKKIVKDINIKVKSQPHTDLFEKESKNIQSELVDIERNVTDYDDVLELMSHERQALYQGDTFRDYELFDPTIDRRENSYIASRYDIDDLDLSPSCFPNRRPMGYYNPIESSSLSKKDKLKLIHINLTDQILNAISFSNTTERTQINDLIADMIINLHENNKIPLSKLINVASESTISPEGTKLLSPELFLFLIKHPSCKSDVTLLINNNRTLLDTSLVDKYFDRFYKYSNGDLKATRKIISNCQTNDAELNKKIYSIANCLLRNNGEWTIENSELMKMFKENPKAFEKYYEEIQELAENKQNATKIYKIFKKQIKEYKELEKEIEQKIKTINEENVTPIIRTIEKEAENLGIKVVNYSENTIGYERLVDFKHKMLRKMIDAKHNTPNSNLKIGWLDNKAVNRIMAILKYECEHAKEGKTIKFDKAEELIEQNATPKEIINQLKNLKQQ